MPILARTIEPAQVGSTTHFGTLSRFVNIPLFTNCLVLLLFQNQIAAGDQNVVEGFDSDNRVSGKPDQCSRRWISQ